MGLKRTAECLYELGIFQGRNPRVGFTSEGGAKGALSFDN